MVWLTETGEESRRVEQRRLQYPQEIRIRHDLPMKFPIIQKTNKQTNKTNINTNKETLICEIVEKGS